MVCGSLDDALGASFLQYLGYGVYCFLHFEIILYKFVLDARGRMYYNDMSQPDCNTWQHKMDAVCLFLSDDVAWCTVVNISLIYRIFYYQIISFIMLERVIGHLYNNHIMSYWPTIHEPINIYLNFAFISLNISNGEMLWT